MKSGRQEIAQRVPIVRNIGLIGLVAASVLLCSAQSFEPAPRLYRAKPEDLPPWTEQINFVSSGWTAAESRAGSSAGAEWAGPEPEPLNCWLSLRFRCVNYEGMSLYRASGDYCAPVVVRTRPFAPEETGIVTSTSVPAPGLLQRWSIAPRVSALSCIPSIPQ